MLLLHPGWSLSFLQSVVPCIASWTCVEAETSCHLQVATSNFARGSPPGTSKWSQAIVQLAPCPHDFFCGKFPSGGGETREGHNCEAFGARPALPSSRRRPPSQEADAQWGKVPSAPQRLFVALKGWCCLTGSVIASISCPYSRFLWVRCGGNLILKQQKGLPTIA